MARTNNLTNFLTDVADAIREKTGESGTIQASEFDTAIENIPSGGSSTINWSSMSLDGSVVENASNNYSLAGLYSGLNFLHNLDTTQSNWSNFWQNYNDNNLIYIPDISSEGSFITNLAGAFANAPIKSVESIDTSNVQIFNTAFYNCKDLVDLPVFDMSSATEIAGMLSGTDNLSIQSMLNMLQSLLTATNLDVNQKDFSNCWPNFSTLYSHIDPSGTVCQQIESYLTALEDDGWIV